MVTNVQMFCINGQPQKFWYRSRPVAPTLAKVGLGQPFATRSCKTLIYLVRYSNYSGAQRVRSLAAGLAECT